MESITELDNIQFDALQEVGNIGAAHASNALGQMVGETVTITVPRATFPLPVEELVTVFGNEEDNVLVIYFKIFGDIEGSMIISFPEEHAILISNYLMGTKDDCLELTEGKKSALKEIGNILSCSYLTALSQLTGFNLMPSIPHIGFDMVGAIVDPLIIEICNTSEEVLITDTEFILGNESIMGNIITSFGTESFVTMLRALGLDV